MSWRRCSNRNIALSIFIVSVSLFLLPALLSYFRSPDSGNLASVKRDVQRYVNGADVIQSISLKHRSNSSRLKNDGFRHSHHVKHEQIVILADENSQSQFGRRRKTVSPEIDLQLPQVQQRESVKRLSTTQPPAAKEGGEDTDDADASKKATPGSFRSRFPPANETADIIHYLHYQLVSGSSPALKYEPNNDQVPDVFAAWHGSKRPYCDGRFQTYSNLFAQLHNVILDQSFAVGRAGGEAIETVINQDERKEYYDLSMGYFQIPCNLRPGVIFESQNHLNDWLFNTATQDLSTDSVGETIDAFTIVVQRYEYVNLYHTMTDWYNAFLVMRFFGKSAEQTNIVWIDAHPKGSLDGVWSTLFNSATRVSALQRRTKFADIVWGIMGYSSYIANFNEVQLPLVEDFRKFFLARHGISPASHRLNCSDVSVLFVWRRDYVAHPRNPSGSIARKIANERQLLAETRKSLRLFSSRVIGVQIDRLDMTTQLQLIANTDILVGMHGAGLSHTLFLPPHAALIELVPYYAAPLEHFSSMARWRDLHYESWLNEDPHNEMPSQKTYVPPHVVRDRIAKSLRKMCGRSVVMDNGSVKRLPSAKASDRTTPVSR